MFEPNQYIVILRDGSKSGGFRRNNVYKIAFNHDFITVQKDSHNKINNGWKDLKYIHNDDWREATSEEIVNYDLNKGPVRANNTLDMLWKKLTEMEKILK